MTEASVSFAGNLTDDPELRHTEGGIARAIFRVAVSGRREHPLCQPLVRQVVVPNH
jgi:single-stranded DNA-binding protein